MTGDLSMGLNISVNRSWRCVSDITVTLVQMCEDTFGPVERRVPARSRVCARRD
jgi:hypothetical protein